MSGECVGYWKFYFCSEFVVPGYIDVIQWVCNNKYCCTQIAVY